MTPTPINGGNFGGAGGWGNPLDTHQGYPSEFSGAKGHHYTNPGYGMPAGGSGYAGKFDVDFD